MKRFVSIVAMLCAVVGPAARQASESDVVAFVKTLDAAAADGLWPGFEPSRWPIALFDGKQTTLLHHSSPPPEFIPLAGRPGVFVMAGRHPAVVGNSTRDIAGVRTATIVLPPGRSLESSALACLEEVFHVFWAAGHTNFRPNEMARYAYPVKDVRNLRRKLAEDEALARALEAPTLRDAASWSAAALRIRGERIPRLSEAERAFETGLEMMEGTANYVARVAAGQRPEATAARLRAEREAEEIRWRYYDSGTAICLLLDRFGPGWKTRIERDHQRTTEELLRDALATWRGRRAAFSAAETSRFDSRAAAAIATLSAKQRRVREDVLGRPGKRIVIEAPGGAEPLRVGRFDPINLLVLEGGEMAHANFITLSSPRGSVEVANPAFARGSFAGTATLTGAAGRHPLTDGIRTVTIVGVRGTPRIDRAEDRLTMEADGVRVSLRGAQLRSEGETIRIILPARP